jgi:isocitrate lyase
MVDRIREVIPNAKLVYNNSPSFDWTLNFSQQIFDAWDKQGKDMSAYDRDHLMSAEYDDSELGKAVEYKDTELSNILRASMFANIHDDSRWQPFLERIGMSP